MRHRLTVPAAFLAGAFAVLVAPALADTRSEHQSIAKQEFAKMHWVAGTQKLAQSHGTFTVPRGGTMVSGAEAVRADNLINGTDDTSTEGFVELKHRSLYLSYTDEGFVTADDWKDVNADELLKNIRDSTDEANEQRTKSGVSALHIDGWVQKPVFDEARKSVRWVTRAHDDHGSLVNAVALQLGRHGYERFTLVSDGSDPKGDAAQLAAAVQAYRFDKGFRFSDYVPGDKVAGYGIAALVGTAAGATIAKTVGFGAILLLIKKFFLVFVALGLGAFRYLKGMFVRKPLVPMTEPAPPPPTAPTA
jgi:uncharacterized membrane-anchored protein